MTTGRTTPVPGGTLEADLPRLLLAAACLVVVPGCIDYGDDPVSDGGDGGDGGSGGTACIDGDLGSAEGDAVATGHLDAGSGAIDNDCIIGSGEESAWTWTAPTTSKYTIDTEGSDLDTILAVNAGQACGEGNITCNDDVDWAAGTWSGVLVDAEAGDVLTIIVDTFDETEAGDWVLNINEGPPKQIGGDTGSG